MVESFDNFKGTFRSSSYSRKAFIKWNSKWYVFNV